MNRRETDKPSIRRRIAASISPETLAAVLVVALLAVTVVILLSGASAGA